MGWNRMSPFFFNLFELKYIESLIVCFKTDLTGKESFIACFTGKVGFEGCYVEGFIL